MSYRAIEVARHILNYSAEQGYPLSNLKLQKVLYFVQAEFLVTKDEKCFDEKILSYNFGPVVEEVYDEYKVFGGSQISPFNEYLKNIKHIDFKDDVIKEEDKKLINGVIDETIVYSNSRLGDFIQNQDPWREAYSPYYKQEITCELLKEFFKDDRKEHIR